MFNLFAKSVLKLVGTSQIATRPCIGLTNIRKPRVVVEYAEKLVTRPYILNSDLNNFMSVQIS